MLTFKKIIKHIPVIGDISRAIYYRFPKQKITQQSFPGSQLFWEDRYKNGDNSGVGSYGKFAQFKAQIINSFIKENHIESVMEFGSGDGNQISLGDYPRYIGFDVSKTSIAKCRELFCRDATKSFYLIEDYQNEIADLTLSLDVIYHLIEDDVFENYMHLLFQSSRRFIIIYSSDTDDNSRIDGSHIRHRKFSDWIKVNAKNWSLKNRIQNKYPFNGNYIEGSFSDFFVYENTA